MNCGEAGVGDVHPYTPELEFADGRIDIGAIYAVRSLESFGSYLWSSHSENQFSGHFLTASQCIATAIAYGKACIAEQRTAIEKCSKSKGPNLKFLLNKPPTFVNQTLDSHTDS